MDTFPEGYKPLTMGELIAKGNKRKRKPRPAQSKPSANITWDWQGAEREYTTSPEPLRGMKVQWMTDLAQRYGTSYINLVAFKDRWGWDKIREENAVLVRIGEKAGEDRVRAELAAVVTPDAPTAILAPALQHKLACADAIDDLDRRNALNEERDSLLSDLHAVNDQMRELVENNALTTFVATKNGEAKIINPKVQALKIVTDTLMRRTQIISTLLGDPKKVAPGVVNNNLNLTLPEANEQVKDLKATMNQVMQFHAQPITAFEPHTEIVVTPDDFTGKPLTTQIEDAIVDAEELT